MFLLNSTLTAEVSESNKSKVEVGKALHPRLLHEMGKSPGLPS